MSEFSNKPSLPHGTVVGVASTGVIGYNSNYEHIVQSDDEPYDHISYVKDSRGKLHYSGHKWQCVEFARRWWISELDVYLPGVPRACDIWTMPLKKVRNLSSSNIEYVALQHCSQGESTSRPAVHDALIWQRTEKAPVGHIAVVSEVSDTFVRVAEQNVDNDVMWKGGHFAREFPLERRDDGSWFIRDDEDPLHGWVRVNKDSSEEAPVWTIPTVDQLQVTGVYDQATEDALSKFVGTSKPTNLTPEEMAKWGPFLSRITDYSLAAFLNTQHPSYPNFVVCEWLGWADTPHNRHSLMCKLQSFLNSHPVLTEAEQLLDETGDWNEPTVRAIQHLLNKVHAMDEFESAIAHYETHARSS